MNWKLLVIGLLVLVILVSGCLQNKDTHPKEISVETEKTEYLQTEMETIKINITNNKDQPIYYVWMCHEDEIKINDAWQKIEFADSCKYDPIYQLDRNDKIESGGSVTVNFDRIYQAGTHRIGIHIYLGSVDETNHQVMYSNEFIFKECEIDSDCKLREMISSCQPARSECVNYSCEVGCFY